MQLIECVPNVSEGRNNPIIDNLADCIRAVNGVSLLNIDSNKDANRTVFTFVGEPNKVCEACFELIKKASFFIDMRLHHGAHPRLGAVDVCPLIPLKNISLEQTAVYADKLARRVAEELNIPIYLYERNARTPQRQNLAVIRRGEYESLPQKLIIFPPDYGPKTFSFSVAKTGASVIGARNFLVAFNMSLNTKDVALAKQIAASLREKNDGLPAVKAIGWYMPDYNCAQVSCNLTNYHKTSLAVLFETCKLRATQLGLKITGSELIGMIPKEALIQAGQFYLPNTPEENLLIQTAVEQLLLNKIQPFIASNRILEINLKN